MRAVLLYVGIWLLAFLLRAVYLLEIQDSPLFHALIGDAWKHDAWARQIASGAGAGDPVFFITPAYAYFLAGIYSLFGHSVTLVRWIQAALGATSCVLLAGAGKRFFGLKAGLLAGLLLAVTPSAIFFDGLIQKSALDLLFLTLFLFLAGGAAQSPRPAKWLGMGAALGLFSLTRENGLALLPVACGWLWLQFRAVPAARRARWLLFLALGTALALSPVTLRNLWKGGEFHPTSSQFGQSFYIGNNRETNGIYMPLRWGRGNIQFEEIDGVELAEEAAGRKLKPAEVSDFWFRKALGEIRADPARWLRLMGRKFLLIWNATEIGDSEDIYTYADSSALLRALNGLFHFGVICPLAVFGMVITGRRWRKLSLLYALLLGYSVSLSFFMVFARYRYPLVPVLLLFAAGGIREAWTWARAPQPAKRRGPPSPAFARWRMPVVAAGAALAAAIPVNLPLVSRGFVSSNSHYNIGTLRLNEKRFEEAVLELQTAVRQEPNAPSAHNNLGSALAGLGRRQEAIASFQEAIRLRPDYPKAHYNLGVAYLEDGKPEEARRHFEESLRQDPRQPAALYNLGSILYQQGRLEEALSYYTQSLELQPDFIEAHQAMALVFAKQGQIEKAVAQFFEVLRLKPRDPDTHYKIGLLLQSRGQSEEAAMHFAAAGKAPSKP